ncbi:DUF1742-domain-containing protein [Xylona heveae TC161]|uniref:DUF1742-domain-containing protein n=1 Tax=Xylona heveae (strain CBS 132557 / TC161) TaxID=1328760 RepID=A0A165J5M3_XYLHT|nr:DUF1742-domain-containing protein [Xylona heveae TC161]KZF25762.1 DUF1742-domain-containing protein [Xylona heveae TC161]
MAIPNIWHQRRVAETASRPCWICFKPTSAVLHNPENNDFFYICLGHLKDKGFAAPIINEADVAARRKQEEMEAEIQRLKTEYEEKQKRKEEKEKEKEKDKNEKEKEKDKKKEDEEGEKDKKDETDKAKSSEKSPSGTATPTASKDDTPRVFSLQKHFYQMRIDRLRKAELAKRNMHRLQSPNVFPSVPSGEPGPGP